MWHRAVRYALMAGKAAAAGDELERDEQVQIETVKVHDVVVAQILLQP